MRFSLLVYVGFFLRLKRLWPLHEVVCACVCFLFCRNPTPIQVWFSHIFALTHVSSFQEMSSKAITIFFFALRKTFIEKSKSSHSRSHS